MDSKSFKIKTVSFSEHPVIDFTQSEPGKFEISAMGLNCPSNFIQDGIFLMDAYCESILYKVTELCKSELLDFLEYQCSKVKKPTEWLGHLETLVDINSDYFDDEYKQSILYKLDINIQVCRGNMKHIRKPLKTQLINWDEIIPAGNPSKFDFNMVKFDLQKLDSFTAKKEYLIELKADFLQSENICSVAANKSFGTLIDIELRKIEEIEKLHPNSEEAKVGKFASFASDKKPDRLRINGNTNILVDFFYRMLYEFMPEGKPFIDNTPTEVANVIVQNFLGKDGKNISLSTVQSTLSPGKVEKRPTCDKRICIHHLIQPSIILFNMYVIDYLNIIDIFPMLN